MLLIWCYPKGSVAHQLWTESAVCVPLNIFIKCNKQESVVTFGGAHASVAEESCLLKRITWLIGMWFSMFQRHFDPWDVRNCPSDILSHFRRLWLGCRSHCFKGTLIREMSETAHLTYCHLPEDFDWGVVPIVSKALWSVRCEKLHIQHTVTSQKSLSWRYCCTRKHKNLP